MTDLNVNQIHAMIQALGFDIPEEDLIEIAHRVNVAQEILSEIDHPELDSTIPLQISWLSREKPDGG